MDYTDHYIIMNCAEQIFEGWNKIISGRLYITLSKLSNKSWVEATLVITGKRMENIPEGREASARPCSQKQNVEFEGWRQMWVTRAQRLNLDRQAGKEKLLDHAIGFRFPYSFYVF